MKKIFYLFFFLISTLVFCQKITEQQAENSTDMRVVAAFIKQNPTHPRVGEFKRKLISILNSEKSPEDQSKIAKPVVKPLNKEVLKTDVKSTVSTKSTSPRSTAENEKSKKTVALLNHMFNNDPTSKEAYVQIINQSKCNLIVKFNGKKFYNLTVPANNENFIIVEKGSYTLTSSICDAKYSSTKNISQDISVTLNSPRK